MESETINSLPDDLIVKILSSLSIKKLVATSILSKRWRSLWKSVTKLNYDWYSRSLPLFRDFVSEQGPLLQSCDLKFLPNCKIAYFIDQLADLSIREMRIEATYSNITLPRSLYTTFGNLQTLILERLSLVDVVVDSNLRFLKTLHLLSVRFSDDESVQRLLSSCPVLENLVVRRTSYVNVMMFSIKVPTLKCLSINYTSMVSPPKGEGDHGFVIDVPSLKNLNIRDYFSNVLQFGHMPQLVNANVDIACDHHLNSILEKAPRLQVLKVKLKKSVGDSSVTDFVDLWYPPCFVPQCLTSHLETLEWRHYNGTKEEKRVADYILENANCLKIATFSSLSAEKDQIFKKLESVPRLSEACQLLFKKRTTDHEQSTSEITSKIASDLCEANKNAKRKRESSILLQKEAMSILTRGVPETVVAKWDEAFSASTRMGSKSEDTNIGYVADEWDEEYENGKQKKIRIKEESCGGSNPLQMLSEYE